MKLEECRQQIDELDASIVSLLNRRAVMSQKIGQIKLRAGLPIVDREREETVLRRVANRNSGEIDDNALDRIYREILNESRKMQDTLGEKRSAIEEISK